MKVVSEATLIVNKLQRKRTKLPQTFKSFSTVQTAELVDEIRGQWLNRANKKSNKGDFMLPSPMHNQCHVPPFDHLK